MPNPHITTELGMLLDGRMSEHERVVAEAHLRVCKDCRKEWLALTALWEELRRVPSVSPSTGFTERVVRSLDTVPQETYVHWVPWKRWGLATAAAAVLGMAVLTAVLLRPQPEIVSAPEEQRIEFKVAEHYELLQDLELIAALDQLE